MLASRFLANYEMLVGSPSLGHTVFLKSMFRTE
jgi:hypothetical protein